MRKKIIGLGIAIWLLASPLQAFVDMPNLIQNTITAVQEVLSYSKEITDWTKTITYYMDTIKNMKSEIEKVSGIKDFVQNFNEISKIYSDFNDIYKNVDDFKKQVLKDPQGFINGTLKDNFKKYQLFNNCENLKGDELNICLRQTINYAFEYDELSRNQAQFEKLKKNVLDKLENQVNSSDDLKGSMDVNNRLAQANTQTQSLQLKLLQDLHRFQISEVELRDQRNQLLTKNVFTKTDSTWLKAPTSY